jgi:hypothetical protein
VAGLSRLVLGDLEVRNERVLVAEEPVEELGGAILESLKTGRIKAQALANAPADYPGHQHSGE